MDDAAAELPDPIEGGLQIGNGEVGQRVGISGPATALVHPDGRTIDIGLPTLSLTFTARIQRRGEEPGPEAPGPIRVVGGKLDE